MLAEILNNNSDVYFKVRKTAGSAANLRLISQEYVDIAFVQSDVMKDAYNGTGYFDAMIAKGNNASGYAGMPGNGSGGMMHGAMNANEDLQKALYTACKLQDEIDIDNNSNN